MSACSYAVAVSLSRGGPSAEASRCLLTQGVAAQGEAACAVTTDVRGGPTVDVVRTACRVQRRRVASKATAEEL